MEIHMCSAHTTKLTGVGHSPRQKPRGTQPLPSKGKGVETSS